jgi:hypothetical protein
MIHATHASLVTANTPGIVNMRSAGTVTAHAVRTVTTNAASTVILLAPILEGSEAKDLLFPGPSIFRAKQNLHHRNFIGGK